METTTAIVTPLVSVSLPSAFCLTAVSGTAVVVVVVVVVVVSTLNTMIHRHKKTTSLKLTLTLWHIAVFPSWARCSGVAPQPELQASPCWIPAVAVAAHRRPHCVCPGLAAVPVCCGGHCAGVVLASGSPVQAVHTWSHEEFIRVHTRLGPFIPISRKGGFTTSTGPAQFFLVLPYIVTNLPLTMKLSLSYQCNQRYPLYCQPVSGNTSGRVSGDLYPLHESSTVHLPSLYEIEIVLRLFFQIRCPLTM